MAAEVKRMNLGCGSVQPEGWINVDRDTDHFNGEWGTDQYLDVINTELTEIIAKRYGWTDLDYIVCNHMLSDIGHHDLVAALKNIRSMLKEGGVLRILVPDIAKAIEAWQLRDEAWFPQDSRTGGLDAKFCTFVMWFGESRSCFTYYYLRELLMKAGFRDISPELSCFESKYNLDGLTDLDDRCTEALIVEARK